MIEPVDAEGDGGGGGGWVTAGVDGAVVSDVADEGLVSGGVGGADVFGDEDGAVLAARLAGAAVPEAVERP